MTKLTYKIGNAEVVSYSMALELKRRTGLPIERIYREVEEDVKINPERREKKLRQFARKKA